MNKTTTPIALDANVTNTYLGGQGCACGCTGTYSMTPRSIKSRINTINAAIKSGADVEIDVFAGGETCVSYEYYTPAGYPKAVRVYTKA